MTRLRMVFADKFRDARAAEILRDASLPPPLCTCSSRRSSASPSAAVLKRVLKNENGRVVRDGRRGRGGGGGRFASLEALEGNAGEKRRRRRGPRRAVPAVATADANESARLRTTKARRRWTERLRKKQTTRTDERNRDDRVDAYRPGAGRARSARDARGAPPRRGRRRRFDNVSVLPVPARGHRGGSRFEFSRSRTYASGGPVSGGRRDARAERVRRGNPRVRESRRIGLAERRDRVSVTRVGHRGLAPRPPVPVVPAPRGLGPAPARAATQPRGARASVWKRGGEKSFLRRRRGGAAPSPRTPSSVAARRWSPPSRRGSSTRHRSSAACDAWRLPPRRNSASRVSRVSRRTRFQGETPRRPRRSEVSETEESLETRGLFDVVPRNVRGGALRRAARATAVVFRWSGSPVAARLAATGDAAAVASRGARRFAARVEVSNRPFGAATQSAAARAPRGGASHNRRLATDGRRGTCDSRSKCPRPSRRDPRRRAGGSRHERHGGRCDDRPPPRPRTRTRSRRSRTGSAPSRTTSVCGGGGEPSQSEASTEASRERPDAGAALVRCVARILRAAETYFPARRGGCRGGSRDSTRARAENCVKRLKRNERVDANIFLNYFT